MAKPRGQETFGDMLRTAGIFAVLIVAVVALLPKGHQQPAAARVDYSADLSTISHRAPFPVLRPLGLAPADWIATNVRIALPSATDRYASLHLGFYVARRDAYAAYDQGNAPSLVAAVLGAGAHPTGSEAVAGRTYALWTDAAGRPALVRPVGVSTLVVHGKASLAVLEQLAGALQPAAG